MLSSVVLPIRAAHFNTRCLMQMQIKSFILLNFKSHSLNENISGRVAIIRTYFPEGLIPYKWFDFVLLCLLLLFFLLSDNFLLFKKLIIGRFIGSGLELGYRS